MKTKNKLVSIGAGVFAVLVATTVFFSLPVDASTTLSIDVPTNEYRVGDTVNVSILCSTSVFVKAWECKLGFDNNVLNADKVVEGDFFSGFSTFFNNGSIDNNDGVIKDLYNLVIGQGNVSGSGTIIDVSFIAIGCGSSDLFLFDVGVTNESMYLSSSVVNGSIFVFSRFDMNCDKTVNLMDILLVASHYGESGVDGWIVEDVNNDGQIRILDLVLVAVNWGSY